MLADLLEKNKQWAARVEAENPSFFEGLSKQQSPEILWIGCSDSRVPATQIMDLMPGDLFVHRNIANVVAHTDFSSLSVIQYAVEVLKVKHVIVCGHYGCGGVKAALDRLEVGMIDHWLRHIKDVRRVHNDVLESKGSEQEKFDTLCELNVMEQVKNVCSTNSVIKTWKSGADLQVHGWIYDIANGRLKDLEVSASGFEDVSEIYRPAGQ